MIASNGHVRDLPKSTLGIDIENDFEPKYITIRGKGEVLAALRKAVKKADKVYLATDPDREGEAISWHLYYALKLENKNYSRITFNEITKTAVKDSIKHARDIDMNLVDAQQARRVLDRIVGYQISPILWANAHPADVALPDRRCGTGCLFDDQRLSQQQVGGCSEWHSRASHLPHHMDRNFGSFAAYLLFGRFCSDAHQWRELCRLALAQAFRYVCHHIAPDAGGRNRCRLFRCHTLYSEEKLK